MSIGRIAMDVKRFNNGLRMAACALALLAVAPASYAQRPHSTEADAPVWNQAAKNQVLEKMSNMILTSAYVPGIDFSKWEAVVAKIKPEAEKAKSEEEFAGIVNAGLRDAFQISHINLIPPRAVENRVTGKMVGIGIRINLVEDGVQVTSTVPGAPAQKAGIEPGDVIMEADGHHVDGPTYIAGPEGTSVNLKVKKGDGTTIKMYKVTRASFNTKQPEELIWLDKDAKSTAVVKINTFDLSYSRDNVDAIMQKAMGAKNLIIDLRNNGGGAVGNMMHFLATVLPQGTAIGTFVNKRMVDEFVEKTKGDKNNLSGIAEFSPDKVKVGRNNFGPYKGHVVVLVNGGSGSASEITAEALKELAGASIVGEKSAGAVLVSIMGDLPHNFNIQFPISDYVSMKGVRLEANGVAPDLEAKSVAFVKHGEVDPVYTAASNYLAKIAKSGS
jgi:carboxyl-terminal processing protease